MEWMLLPYRRYFEFSGRSRRKEFWLFTLFYVLVTLAIDFGLGGTYSHMWREGIVVHNQPGMLASAVGGIFALASFFPSLAVQIRRLHDIDRSGWWFLMWFVPLVGWIVMLVFLCLDGTYGSNRYGPDPKGRGMVDVFS